MFKKNIFLKVSRNNVIDLMDYKESNTKGYENIKVNINNKRVNIMLEGEEIHMKLLQIPKKASKNVESIIENEMLYLYGSKAENIYYDYNILRENKDYLEVIIFCVNSEVLNNLKSYKNIRSVKLAQIHFLEHLRKKRHIDEGIIIFKYWNSIYFVALNGGKIISNKVLNSYDDDQLNLIKQLECIKERIYYTNCKMNKIYTVNIKNKEFKEHLNNVKNFSYKDLGVIDEKELNSSFMKNRRWI